MDHMLNDEQRAFAAELRRFCDERIAPHAREVDRTGRIPDRAWTDLAEIGYARLYHPEALGGVGADGITLAIAVETLSRACASTAWSATISAALAGKLLYNLGTPEHHERWLRPLVAGEILGCFGAVGRGSGSDTASDDTSLRRRGDGYVLRGEKPWVSNGPTARVAVITARLDGGSMGAAILDLDQPGVTRGSLERIGLRGVPWGALYFDDVPVAAADVIGPVDMSRLLESVAWGQFLMCWSSIGLAEEAHAQSVAFAREHVAFGRPILHMDSVHARLSGMRAEIDAARLLALDAAWQTGRGPEARALLMMAKVYATEMAVRVADAAMKLHGARGFTTEYPIERLYRDSLGNVPAGLTTDRIRELIACPLVGADPWNYDPFDWLPDVELGA